MAFSITLSLGTVGSSISNVKLYGCNSSIGGECTSCTPLSGYENVGVATFPRVISGIPDGSTYIKVEAVGECSGSAQECIPITGLPITPSECGRTTIGNSVYIVQEIRNLDGITGAINVNNNVTSLFNAQYNLSLIVAGEKIFHTTSVIYMESINIGVKGYGIDNISSCFTISDGYYIYANEFSNGSVISTNSILHFVGGILVEILPQIGISISPSPSPTRTPSVTPTISPSQP